MNETFIEFLIQLNCHGYTITFSSDFNSDNTCIKIMKECNGKIYVQYHHFAKASMDYCMSNVDQTIRDVIMCMVDTIDNHILRDTYRPEPIFSKETLWQSTTYQEPNPDPMIIKD